MNRYFKAVGIVSCLLIVLLSSSFLSAEEKANKTSYINVKDYPSINAAIKAAKKQRIRRIYIPAGNYQITKTIDLTGYYGERDAVILEGDGPTSRLIGKTGKYPIIDMTTSGHCQIKDLTIVGKDADVGILMARVGGGSAGWNYFYGLYMYGSFRKAAIYSLGSEVNRFVSSEIWNNWKGKEGGDGIVFTQRNIYNVESPKFKEKTSGGCNTELSLFGVTISTLGPNSVGLKIVGMASDVRVYGSYFHSDGFSAIYLDGTKGRVDNVSFRDVRIEGEHGKHDLYARGQVRNLIVEGGEWNSNFEPIKQEDAPSWTDKHYSPDNQGAAYNWRIENILFTIHDGVDYKPGGVHPNPKVTEYSLTKDGYVFMHFDRLINSRIRAVFMEPTKSRLGPDGKLVNQAPWRGDKLPMKAVVVEKKALGNRFTVEKKADVVLRGEVKGNKIDALSE